MARGFSGMPRGWRGSPVPFLTTSSTCTEGGWTRCQCRGILYELRSRSGPFLGQLMERSPMAGFLITIDLFSWMSS